MIIRRSQSLITSYFTNQPNQILINNDSDTSDVNPHDRSGILPIYYNNVRCISSKRNINMKIELSQYEVLCFTETWLTNEHTNVYFPRKFHVYRRDRHTSGVDRSAPSRGGGVAVIVHQKFMSKQIQITSDDDCEAIAVEISTKPVPLLVYVVYMRSFDRIIAMKHLKSMSKIATDFSQHRKIIVGDFNIHSINWLIDDTNMHYIPVGLSTHENSEYHRGTTDFLRGMQAVPFYQLSNIENAFSNTLDLLFVDQVGDVELSEDNHNIIETSQQDVAHKPFEILFTYCQTTTTILDEYIEIPCYKRANIERMIEELLMIDFESVFDGLDLDESHEYFSDTLIRLIHDNVPKITIKQFSNKPKWWNRDLQRMKNRRDKLFKRKSNANGISEYTQAVNEFNQLNQRLHDDYVNRVQTGIRDDPAEFWKFAKISGNITTYPKEMIYRDQKATSKLSIVELFADYFESIFDRDEVDWEFDDIFRAHPTALEIEVTLDDIATAINSLKTKAGAGPDGIPPIIIKMCSCAVVWPIWLIYQKSFNAGKLPNKLKISRVVPVYKKAGKSDVRNYRIIAISSVLSKIFERAIKTKLMNIIDPYLSDAQHGFRQKRSVMTNLIELSTRVYEAFAKGNQVDIFYGDFKNAFDLVCHRILISKLGSFNIGPLTAKLLCEFLTDRLNYVQIDSTKSREYRSPSGVPAGSTLGPVLFLMFINDLSQCSENTSILMFADDVKILREIRNVRDTCLLQTDINNLLRWCVANRLHFNVQKCAAFTAYRSRTTVNVDYFVAEHKLERKVEIRDLGVLVDQKFHFGHHIEQITAQARQMIGLIKRVSNGNFTKETQRILYLAYARTKLEFASQIWNPHLEVYKDDIESVQKQFVIYLLDNRRNATTYRLAPYIDRCEALKIDPLEVRRKVADALFAYDVYMNNVDSSYLRSKFVNIEHTRNLRRVRLLNEPMYNRDYLSAQPLARFIGILNSNAQLLRETNIRVKFKTEIRKKTIENYSSIT